MPGYSKAPGVFLSSHR